MNKFNERIEEILEGNYKKVRLAIGGSKLMGYASEPKHDKSKLPSKVKHFYSLSPEEVAQDIIALGDKKILKSLKEIYVNDSLMYDNKKLIEEVQPIMLEFYADYYESMNDLTTRRMGKLWPYNGLYQAINKIATAKGWEK